MLILPMLADVILCQYVDSAWLGLKRVRRESMLGPLLLSDVRSLSQCFSTSIELQVNLSAFLLVQIVPNDY